MTTLNPSRSKRSPSRSKRSVYVQDDTPAVLAALGLVPYNTSPFEEGMRLFIGILAVAAALYFIGWSTYGFSQMMVESFKWLGQFKAAELLHYTALITGAIFCYLIPVIIFCPQVLY